MFHGSDFCTSLESKLRHLLALQFSVTQATDMQLKQDIPTVVLKQFLNLVTLYLPLSFQAAPMDSHVLVVMEKPPAACL